jgi:acylphosphatase
LSQARDRSVRVFARGRVQGVWFRQSTAERARERGVAGWVRNLEDGRVEARLQGPAEAVGDVLSWIGAGGPASARVDALEVADAPVDDVLGPGFEIRR